MKRMDAAPQLGGKVVAGNESSAAGGRSPLPAEKVVDRQGDDAHCGEHDRERYREFMTGRGYARALRIQSLMVSTASFSIPM